MCAHYTLTFVPSNNKNIYYTKVIAEGSKDKVEQVMFDIVGRPLEQMCDPFCEREDCEDCVDNGGCTDKCGCFTTKNYKCYQFYKGEEEMIHKKINISKDFVYSFVDPSTPTPMRDHFRINEWSSESKFNKKNFLKMIQSKIF
jgi:hypothetical protein